MSLSDLDAIPRHSYIQVAALSFLYYDHVLTFPAEVSRMWSQPISKNTLLFFLNRYVAFLGNIAVAVITFAGVSTTHESCKAVGFLRQSLMILSQILVSVTLATRIIALYSNSRRIIILVLGSGFLLTGVSCWSLVGQHSTLLVGIRGCHFLMSEATGIHIASAWEAQALFDALVFVLTVRQTLKTRALHRTSFNLSGAGLVDIVWRDGALYFAIMGFANLANIFTFYLSGPTLKGVFSTPASCISVTMCSRLVLNLYKAATPDEATASLEPMTTVVLGVYVDSGTFNRVGSDLESTWSGDALTERPDEEVGVAW